MAQVRQVGAGLPPSNPKREHNMKSLDTFWLACAALAVALPAPVIAQSSLLPAPPNSVAQSAGFGKPVATAFLAGHRGGTDTVHNNMNIDGTTSGNAAINVATGTNIIGTGAFANMSGLPVVIQNSGANVLIQNAVILNLQMN